MKTSKHQARHRRRAHLRKTIHGGSERPRLSVFRSLKHIYAQLIDDDKGVLLALSTISPSVREEVKGKKKRNQARKIGEQIAKVCIEKGVTKIVFDRNGFRYHGRVKALAEGARKGGLQF